jgi:hypothetical protein
MLLFEALFRKENLIGRSTLQRPASAGKTGVEQPATKTKNERNLTPGRAAYGSSNI